MKIINEGLKENVDPWWNGYTITCFYCLFSAVLEKTDQPLTKYPNCFNMICPNCHKTIHLTKSNYYPAP